uniref:Uncharacterized protein n=1 Tax=Caenorhabditis japonica TaxID=281687 RepID=A0A8R1INZ9_CAEJA
MSMNLREFLINNPAEMNKLPKEDIASAKDCNLLGYKYNSIEDALTIKLVTLDKPDPSKRQVASYLAKNFDPLGYITPILVPLKTMVRLCWDDGINWNEKLFSVRSDANALPSHSGGRGHVGDEGVQKIERPLAIFSLISLNLTPNACEILCSIGASLQRFIPSISLNQTVLDIWKVLRSGWTHSQISIPRQLTTSYNYSSVKLLLFSDASKEYYAAVAYLHYEFPDQTSQTNILMSKSKIKPNNTETYTIPKLELLGIEIAARISCQIAKEAHITIDNTMFFTDSTIALYWILRKEQKRQWVANRVNEIHARHDELRQKGMDPSFHHCPTESNPADLATRGMTTEEFTNSKIWFHGPDFLKEQPDDWPCRIEGTITCPKDFQDVVYREMINTPTNSKNIKIKSIKSTKKKSKTMLPKPTVKPSTPVTVTVHKSVHHIHHTLLTTQIRNPYVSDVPFHKSNSLKRIISHMYRVMTIIERNLIKHRWQSVLFQAFTKLDKEQYSERRRLIRWYIILEHYKESDKGNLFTNHIGML